MEGRRLRPCFAIALRRFLPASITVALLLASAGCASGGGHVIDGMLEKVGMKAATPQPHALPLRLYAGDNLNAGTEKRPLALVVRVYQLRGYQRFEQAAFDTFLDEQAERNVLGSDLIDVSEVLLTPGQRNELIERLPADAQHVGVVALFRMPAASRWRFSFDSRKAVADGITLGLHACAMTTTSPALVTPIAGDAHGLSGVGCAPVPRLRR